MSPRSGVLQSNFLFGILFLPKPQRDAVKAIYAFCRAVDDAVDLAPPTSSGSAAGAAEELARWREEVELCFKSQPRDPVMKALFPYVRMHRLKREYFALLLEGVGMDVAPRRYATIAELERYCDGVAGAVGLLCLQVFGIHDEPGATAYSRNLSLGLQVTNILRDLGTDACRDRVYLPQEDLSAFEYPEDRLKAGESSDAFHKLAKFEMGRARGYFMAAERAITPAISRRIAGPEIMRATYQALLAKLEAAPDRALDPAAPRAAVGFAERLIIACSTWVRVKHL